MHGFMSLVVCIYVQKQLEFNSNWSNVLKLYKLNASENLIQRTQFSNNN
jgi:hypothetical protein